MAKVKTRSLKEFEDERHKRFDDLKLMAERAGEGLLRSQVDIKYTPWRITWERQDMIMERQERMIELLEDILKELKKKKK